VEVLALLVVAHQQEHKLEPVDLVLVHQLPELLSLVAAVVVVAKTEHLLALALVEQAVAALVALGLEVNQVCLQQQAQQILAVAAEQAEQIHQTAQTADQASSLFDTYFNWRSTWHILQK